MKTLFAIINNVILIFIIFKKDEILLNFSNFNDSFETKKIKIA